MAETGQQRRQAEVVYVVEISSWDWDLHLSINRTAFSGAIHYWRSVIITGKPRGPKLAKVSKAEIRLDPVWNDELVANVRRPVASIGSISVSKGVFEVSQPIPHEVLPSIISMLIADRFKFVRIVGSPLHYRSGEVTGFSLLTRLEADEEATV